MWRGETINRFRTIHFMANAIRTLLNGIIDYAGVFPPANLPLDQAVANYARYRGEAESWMLGRFVCPAARLAELPSDVEMSIAAIARGGDSIAAVIHGLKQDLADIAACWERSGGKIAVGVLEMRFPPTLFGTAKERDAAGLFAAVEKSIAESKTPALSVSFEVPSAGLSAKPVVSFTRTLAMAIEIGAMRKVDRVPPAGVKLRCAGKEYPSSETVARIIAACHANGLRLKFTGGLHHPLRHAEGHGFLNVFVAGIMTHALNLDENKIAEALDAKEFSFSEFELRWRDRAVPMGQIELARKDFVTSFGSCSFDEPRDGLRAAKLL